ncbi:MAG: tetratricopeptide repeat protein [Planctomycetaceae bacterium]|nr:tetratricopeptide repeat protein [Planctomycetaceae bacterium]
MSGSALLKKLQHGVRCHQQGDTETAAQIYREVLCEDPGNADAWHLNGLVEFAHGDRLHAESSLWRAIQLKPDEPEFQANLAAILVQQNRSIEAESVCRRVLRIDGSHCAALSHLGTALRQQRRLHESLETFQLAAKKTSDAAALCNLSSVLIDLGRIEEARRTLETARSMAPQIPQVHINLGAVQREMGDSSSAMESLQRAEELMPDSFEVHVNRGNLFLDIGRSLDAVEEFQKAIAINPAIPSAVAGLGRALQQTGNWEESLEAHRLAAELDPDNQLYQSAYLYSVSLSPGLSRKEVVQRHVEWGRRLEASVRPIERHDIDRNPDRPLRIGYVSPDFRSHATMRFAFSFLRDHHIADYPVVLYSETGRDDETTKAIRALGHTWRPTKGLNDDALAAQIVSDQIDILVDLAGHTAENRLPVFARKPAPIQVSFLGYPTTTGLSRIDYFLTDAIREPGNAQMWFSEQPYFLPHGACCYEVLDQALETGPCPFLANGFLTLGSTHRLEKISPETLRLWALVMSAVPSAKLLLFRDTLKSSAVQNHLKQTLLEYGINTARVTMGWELPANHLQIYDRIDLLLDVFPWGSGTVAYDAMWMGVPIPTLAGERGACRATASMLHHCGFPELIAETPDRYLSTIVRLAQQPEQLVELRQKIRAAMLKTVCNGAQFTRDLEAAYRSMWKRFLTGSATAKASKHARRRKSSR